MAELLAREVLGQEPRSVRDYLDSVAPEGLTVFGASEQRATIVFVHGLQGRKFATWYEFPRLIAQDRAWDACQMAFFGYPTAVLSPRLFFPLLRPYDLESKARELADELLSAHAQLGWPALVLVAHSLGGLVVLGALRACVERATPGDRTLLSTVTELAFYGTPFLGSDRVSRAGALLSADLRALFREDPYRSRLIEWTRRRQMADLLRLESTYARVNVLYSATDFWVDRASARARFPGDSQFNATHTALCKPQSSTQRPYLFLAQIVKRAIERPSTLPKTSTEMATVQRIYDADDPRLPQVAKLYEERLPAEERVPWARIVRSLRESAAAQTDPSFNMRFLTIQVSRGQVCGFASALQVLGHRYAWFAYLASAPGTSGDVGRGLAQQLAREMERSQNDCRGFVIEVDDPQAPLLGPEDVRKRRARIRLYRRLGPIYHVRGLNYLQPRLHPDSEEPELAMHLMFAPIPQTTQLRYLTRDEVVEMLELIRAVQANAYREHPHAQTYREYLERWRDRQVSGLPECVELVRAAQDGA